MAILDESYNLFVQNGYNGSKEDFAELIKTNQEALDTSYEIYQDNGGSLSSDQYAQSLLQGEPPVKKKEQPSPSKPVKSGASKSGAGSSVSPEFLKDIQAGPQKIPVKESATTVPSLYDVGLEKEKPIKPAKKPTLEDNIFQSRRTTAPRPKIKDETPKKPTLEDNIFQSRRTTARRPKIKDETPKEKPYFEGEFGKVLRGFDNPMNPMSFLGLGDFIDDMGRAIGAGFNNGAIVTPANELMVKGAGTDKESIGKWIKAVKESEKLGPSDEMASFSKIYEEEDKSIFGFLKGLAYNPGVTGELIISSFSTLLNPSSAAAAGAVSAGFTATGAATGAAAGGVGAVPGAVGGFLSSIPYAMGAANVALETGLTFSEMLREELTKKGLDFTEENVQKVLEDTEALKSIRTKSAARGLTIGAIDALTGRLAGKVGAKLAEGTGAAKVKAGLAASGIEMVGGSTGEAAGRAVAGQEMDVAEIGLEGIAEAPMAIADVTAEVLKRPVYRINGEKRTEQDVQEIINTASPEDLKKIKIDISNDSKGYGNQIQNIIVRDDIKNEVKSANEKLSDEDLNKIVDLELELKKFEGSKTQSGKDRASQIRSQIKTIQEDAVQKQTTDEGVLRQEEPKVELQKVGEGDQVAEVAPAKAEEEVKIESAVDDNGEIDYEAEQKVRDIAKDRNLGITSDREIAYVAKDNEGNIIGGAFTSYDGDKYTFDVVVDKSSESKGIGSKLLDAVKDMPTDISEQNPEAKVEVDVVSPTMKTMLESRGFKVDRKIGEDRFIMSPAAKVETSGETITTEVAAAVQPATEVAQGQVAPAGVQEGAVGAVAPAAEASAPVLKETFEQKASKLAEKIREAELPRWLAGIQPEDGVTIETKGISVNDIKQKVADAVVEIGKLIDQGVSLVDAVKQKVDELVSIYGEGRRSIIEQNMIKEVSAIQEKKPEGYDRLMNRVKDVMERAKKRGQSNEEALDSVIKNVQANDQTYINATDTQREQIIRDIREMFGKKEKAAPSVRKVMGTPREKITVDEMAALKDQIRLEAKAARDAKKDLNGKRAMVAELVKGMATQGRITARQAESLIRKANSINLDNPVMIDRFVNYAGKVFADAEYASKLSTANSTRKAIKKLSKNKDKAANLTDLAKKFAEIEPSMVEDIDEYNAIAEALASGIKGSTSRGENVNLSAGVVVEDVMGYVSDAMDNQAEMLLEQRKQELADLGIDATGLTYDQMVDLLMDQQKKVNVDKESAVKEVAKKAFDIYSSVIREMLSNNIDPFTGDSTYGMYTDKQKDLVKRFMAMDLNLLDAKQSLAAVDALLNFIQNGSTASMEATVSTYTGEANVNQLAKEGVVGKPLKLYWSPLIGRVFGEQFANLPILFERIFKGFNIGAKVKKLSGVSDVINGKAKAQKISDTIVSAYVSLFANRKPNGQKFNTEFNTIERGMYAFMKRNVIGTQAEFDAEFARRKGIVEESIKRLSEGNSKEKELAKVYQEVYDKILKDAKSIQDVSSNTDAINKDAVNWWVSEWASKFDQMAEVSEGVYNRMLERDLNYTPDRFSKMKAGEEVVEITELESSFHYNNNTPYMRETGSLMEATRPDAAALKKGAYINLSFDSMNANAMYDAMVDIETAAPIRQVSAFMNSDAMKKVIPDAETRDVLVKRVNLAIRSIRKKMPYDNSQLASFMKRMDILAKLGTGQALGGVTQPIKQMGPVMMNTLVNAGRINIKSLFNKSKSDFINRSGYAIANRGVESLANVSSINKILEKAAESSGEKALKFIEKANDLWLKAFLVKPDVFIARASWMTYYERALRKQGISPKSIDWATHEVNEKAADYAQLMVDRQQNVSDADLSGAFFKSEKPLEKFVARTAFAFASFRLNQTMRIATDVTTLTSKTSSLEDKKISALSLSGAGVELLTFKLLAGWLSFLLGSLTKSIMGDDESDEDKEERRKKVINGQVTSSIQDLLSPIPPLDVPVSATASFIAENLQDAIDVRDKNRIEIYGDKPKDYWQTYGTLGITAQKIQDIVDISELGIYGEYKDNYGKTIKITRAHQEIMPYMAGLMAMSTLGLAPSEVGTIARNAEKFAKKGKAKENKKEKEENREIKKKEKEEKAAAKAAKSSEFNMEDMEYEDMYDDLMDQYKDEFE